VEVVEEAAAGVGVVGLEACCAASVRVAAGTVACCMCDKTNQSTKNAIPDWFVGWGLPLVNFVGFFGKRMVTAEAPMGE